MRANRPPQEPPPSAKRGPHKTTVREMDKRLVNRTKLDPLGMLKTPTAAEQDRILERDSRRITEVARAFIIECIICGCSDAQINTLLRHKGYILPGQSDLSRRTLIRVRGLKEAALDPEMLTQEARQVGHNIVSSWIVRWAELGDTAFDALEAMYKSEEPIEMCSPSDCLNLAVNATKVLVGIFGAGLPERLRAELESNMSASITPGEGAEVRLPPKDKILGYIEAVVVGAYEKARLTTEAMDDQELLLESNFADTK